MADKLTPQQETAVWNRGGNLLVSAAAGSGKTKVLVDRLLSYLMDEKAPANLDDFLMITYTKAAASELRAKIAAKLSEKLAQIPENRHLQRQVQRLYLTKISTVHAFCGDLLREYAYKMDIPGDFRVADESECTQLRLSVMESVLDEAYMQADQNEDFRAFVDSQGLGRDDRLVPEIVLKVYDSARCHLDPEGWLDGCLSSSEVCDLSGAEETVWGKYLMQDLFSWLEDRIRALNRCLKEASREPDMGKIVDMLTSVVFQLNRLAESQTWDEIVNRSIIDFGRLTISKKIENQELAERIKAIRNACKEDLPKKTRSFADPSQIVLKDLADSAAAVRGMIGLVRKFAAEYDALKRSRRVLDFGDLEHKTLDLLLGKKRSGPTAAAAEIAERFREIMVDEYQDSNEVQDAIFSALTGKKHNCFMVGDVKQSIYQFRLADPGIFLEKYHAYVPAEEAQIDMGRKVLLSSNFRSGAGVLEAANDVFRLCMHPKVGGLEYTDAEALREGVPHVPLGEPETELYMIQVQENSYVEEANFVAQRIVQLLDGTHMVRDGESLRQIQPEDIVILLRSPGSVGGYFQKALEYAGIPCCNGSGGDLLETVEIGTLRALLQTIRNPRQDIPLLAALAGPVFDFSADDLASFRGKHKHGSIYEALLKDHSPKTERFLEILRCLREEAGMCSLTQLLERLFSMTRMLSIYGAMPGGEARIANLRSFYQIAIDFEAGAGRDLGQFLEYLTLIEGKGLAASAEMSNAGCVTIMSIHKSKGLEFPVVFLSGLSRQFNRESLKAQVLCHKDLGIGVGAVDIQNRLRYPTIAKRAIAVKSAEESLSEEMRVLYVAMTRAKDRLIMTYSSENPESVLSDIALRMDLSGARSISTEAACPGMWVLMSAMNKTEAGAFFALAGKTDNAETGDHPWLIQVIENATQAVNSERKVEEAQMIRADRERIAAGLSYRYPHSEAVKAPSKQTATQRKGRQKDQEVLDKTEQSVLPIRKWRKPSFVEKTLDGRSIGNAIHSAMQYIHYDACGSLAGIHSEMERMTREGFLTEEQAAAVDANKIARFFETELGQKLIHAKEVLREFKFSILEEGSAFGPGLEDEQILMQGVVDCALPEADGLIILDFKSDRVPQENLSAAAERYRLQLQTYSDAMARIFEQTVKQKLLYFFYTDTFVEL